MTFLDKMQIKLFLNHINILELLIKNLKGNIFLAFFSIDTRILLIIVGKQDIQKV